MDPKVGENCVFQNRNYRFQVSDTSSDSESSSEATLSKSSLKKQGKRNTEKANLQNVPEAVQEGEDQSDPDSDGDSSDEVEDSVEDSGEGTSAQAVEADQKQRQKQCKTDLLQTQKQQRSVITELKPFGEETSQKHKGGS